MQVSLSSGGTVDKSMGWLFSFIDAYLRFGQPDQVSIHKSASS